MRCQLLPALRATLVLALLTGLIFPLAITAVAQAVFPSQANGSLLRNARGEVIGSALLGQNFTRPEYFHPRPSAAGTGYDATASGGTNLGPTSRKLLEGAPDDPATKDRDESFAGVEQLAAAYRRENGLGPHTPAPVDAVTRSASGLDPDVTPANALLQAPRVARARGLSAPAVEALVRRQVQPRPFGLLGEPRVNVLALNLALDRLAR